MQTLVGSTSTDKFDRSNSQKRQTKAVSPPSTDDEEVPYHIKGKDDSRAKNEGNRFASSSTNASWLRLPLGVVFGLQILVVFAAFIAVIAVLSIQQEREFKSALYKQLSLQQAAAANELTSPLRQREKQFELLLNLYTKMIPDGGARNPAGTNYPYTVPHDASTVEDTMPFYHLVYDLVTDPDNIVSMVVLTAQTNRPSLTTPFTNEQNMFVVDKTMLAYAQSETIYGCVGAYPMTSSYCTSGVFPVARSVDTGALIGRTSSLLYIWSRPVNIFNPVSQKVFPAMAFSRLLTDVSDTVNIHKGVLLVNTKYFTQIVTEKATPTTASVAALFTPELKNSADWVTMYMVTGGRTSFADTLKPPTGASNETYANSWQGGQTPDSVLNDAFVEGRDRCFSNGLHAARAFLGTMNPCETAQVFEITSGNKKYTASAIRIVDRRTMVDWLMVQYTPREEFFGASDKSRTIGIIIGVLGALVVLISCVLIWLAIFRPLKQLRANMSLAAEMKNDEVAPIAPLLSECQTWFRRLVK